MMIMGLALDPWQLWLALGLVLFVSEVLSGDGTLIALGTAALLTALIERYGRAISALAGRCARGRAFRP